MLYYINLMLKNKVMIPKANSAIFQALHGIFKILDDYQYGIAYENDTLQVFANDSTALSSLIDLLTNNEDVMKLISISEIANVDPDSYEGLWREYSRYKIPSRNADRQIGSPLRRKCMRYADEIGMLYFNIKSKSNKTAFRYYVNIKEYSEPKTLPVVINSNGYGLSTATRQYLLPVCPINVSSGR